MDIDLTSIQNKGCKPDVESIKQPKILPQNIPKPQKHMNDDLKHLLDRYIKPSQKPAKNKIESYKEVHKDTHKDAPSETKALSENDRNKMIALCNLYIAEFPEKLHDYKKKNFNKLSDDELIELKQTMRKLVTTSNSLGMAVESSCKALELYEYVMCDYAGIDIKGVSKLGGTQEYKDCVKAVLLKYLDGSLISQVEPEYKLTYLILSNSVLCHQMNSMGNINKKMDSIEEKPIAKQPEQAKHVLNEDQQIMQKLKLNDLNSEFMDL